MPITDLFTCAVKYFKNLSKDAENTERKPAENRNDYRLF